MENIELLADTVIAQAVNKNATDIHILPRLNNYEILFRIDNNLLFYQELDNHNCIRLISHFKFSAAMDIGERRRPQTGSYRVLINDLQYNLRLSSLPSSSKESLVIRILPQTDELPFESLSLFKESTQILLKLVRQASGLIVLSGPTGCGKSTAAYSLIKEALINSSRNVITLEDPVEKYTPNFVQVQINEKAGIDYATGLKAILRHDPDIIFIGEIRDAETAKIAIQAALTGHLVISSIHSRDAVGVIFRLLQFGIPLIEIQQAMLAATSQRLVQLNRLSKDQSMNRTLVFEILQGRSLEQAFSYIDGKANNLNYHRLGEVIKRGIDLKLIKEFEYERWVKDEL